MFLDKWLGARSEGSLEDRFDSRCLDVHAAGLADPETARTMCDDCRAAYEFDTAEQKADREASRLITRPLRVLWAADGAVVSTTDRQGLAGRDGSEHQGHGPYCGKFALCSG